MTRGTRRFIFLIFLLIFIVLVPVIILYAQGYGFDFEKRTIVASGGIYLKSYPPRAEIYVNNTLRGTTNRMVRRLIPKTYDVKIIKEEFHPWQKNILVKPGLVTREEDIFLVPFNPKIQLVTSGSNEYSYFFEKPYSLNEVTKIIQKKSKYTIFKIDNLNLNIKKDKLYFLSNNNLYSLELNKENIENSILSPILVPNVLNYVMYKNGILYWDYFTEKIYELDLTSLKSAEFFDQVFPGFNQGKWIISNDNKKILCQKDKSLEILWLEDVLDKTIEKRKGEVEKIDLGEQISDLIWLPLTDEHLIVSTNDSILITELDNRPPRNTINFITTEKPQIKYDASDKILYFLSQERLYQTEL